MKIVDVETFSGFIGWRNWLFARVATDEGICGLAEATTGGFVRSVEACIHELKRGLIGRDALGALKHWEGALCGVEPLSRRGRCI